MGKQLIMVRSITFAMKGKNILTRHGIFSDIERTPKTGGEKSCGYSIYAPRKTEQAIEILESEGIEILGVLNKGTKQ